MGCASTRSASGPPTPAPATRAAGSQFIGGEPNAPFDPVGSGAVAAVAVAAGFRRDIDEVTLRAVAEATGGEYYPAESADELLTVLENLPTNTIVKHEVVEISVAFAALGALFAVLAIFLGQAWRPLP